MSSSPTPAVGAGGRSTVAAGIGLMVAGVFVFSIIDVVGKWLMASYSVGELLLVRGITALVLLSPFIWRAGRTAFLSAPRPGLQVLRVSLSTAEVVMFFTAVGYLPLVDVITYYLAAPIIVTAFSAILLGEKVGWRRWTAVVVGFIGVLIALRPSPATLTWPAMIALCGSVFYAFLLITTRFLRSTPDIVLTSSQIIASVLFGAVTAPFAWVTPPLPHLALFMLSGSIALVGLFCVNRSLRLAPASIVVPYQYMLIVWAVLFGYAVFGDVPAAHTLIGAAVIIAAGLYIFMREQAVAKREPTFEAPP